MNVVIYELNDFFEVSPEVQQFETWGSNKRQTVGIDGLSFFNIMVASSDLRI